MIFKQIIEPAAHLHDYIMPYLIGLGYYIFNLVAVFGLFMLNQPFFEKLWAMIWAK
jgi:hypothetical protein